MDCRRTLNPELFADSAPLTAKEEAYWERSRRSGPVDSRPVGLSVLRTESVAEVFGRKRPDLRRSLPEARNERWHVAFGDFGRRWWTVPLAPQENTTACQWVFGIVSHAPAEVPLAGSVEKTEENT